MQRTGSFRERSESKRWNFDFFGRRCKVTFLPVSSIFPAESRKTARITISLNGEKTDVSFAPYKTLLEVLREDLALTGTKHGCDRAWPLAYPPACPSAPWLWLHGGGIGRVRNNAELWTSIGRSSASLPST